ncbi:MAG: DUF4340 domain-containing protein, partial [Planctomycetota bacterium]
MSKSIVGALGLLVVLVVILIIWFPREYTGTRTAKRPKAIEALKSLNAKEVTRIVLSKGKGTVELARKGDEWVVASSYGYPADSVQVEKVLQSLKAMSGEAEEGSLSDSHAEFEVDKESGGFLRLYGKDESGEDSKLLASLVVGKLAAGYGLGANRVYVRFGDEPETYSVESDIRSDARLYSKDLEGRSYLLTEIVKLPDDVEVETVRLERPEKADVIVERRYREVPAEKPEETASSSEGEKEGAEKKPETKKEPYYVVTSGSEVHEIEKSEEWTARGLLDRGKSIRIEDAAEPKELSEYGLDRPQLRATVAYRKKDDPDAELKRLVLLFGNAKKDEKGSTRGYYFTIDEEKFRGRIYVIPDYTFDSWAKEVKDFLPKPKEEPKPEAKEEPKPEAKEEPKPEAKE